MRALNIFLVCAVCGLLVFCEPGPTAVDDAAESSDVTLAKKDDNHGAVRWIPDPFCGVLDSDGNSIIVDCRNQISTYSKNGNALVVAHGWAPNHTGTPVRWDAYNPPQVMLDWFGLEAPPAPCGLLDTEGNFELFTLNWWIHLSASGQATIQCHYAKKWEFQWPE
jgi:hypothetical protein